MKIHPGLTIKKLIHEVKEQSGNSYQLWAEISGCENPEGYQSLKFFSIYSGAKDPTVPHGKGEFLLSPTAMKNLKDLLDGK